MDAVVLNAESLKRFQAIASEVLSRSRVSVPLPFHISRVDHSKSEITLEQLVNDRNPKAEALDSVKIKAQSGDIVVKISIRNSDHTISAEAAAHDVDVVKDFKKAVSKEVRNVRAFYSAIRIKLLEFQNSIWPKVLYWCGVGLWVSLLLITLYASIRSAAVPRQDPSGALEVRPKSVAPPPPEKRGLPDWVINAVTGFGTVLLLVGTLWGLGRVRRALFPPVIFNIGEGSDRYDHIRKWRWFLMGSILVSGLLLKLLLHLAFPSK